MSDELDCRRLRARCFRAWPRLLRASRRGRLCWGRRRGATDRTTSKSASSSQRAAPSASIGAAVAAAAAAAAAAAGLRAAWRGRRVAWRAWRRPGVIQSARPSDTPRSRAETAALRRHRAAAAALLRAPTALWAATANPPHRAPALRLACALTARPISPQLEPRAAPVRLLCEGGQPDEVARRRRLDRRRRHRHSVPGRAVPAEEERLLVEGRRSGRGTLILKTHSISDQMQLSFQLPPAL